MIRVIEIAFYLQMYCIGEDYIFNENSIFLNFIKFYNEKYSITKIIKVNMSDKKNVYIFTLWISDFII